MCWYIHHTCQLIWEEKAGRRRRQRLQHAPRRTYSVPRQKVTPQLSTALMRTIWKSLTPAEDAAVAGARPQRTKRAVAKPMNGLSGQLAITLWLGHCSGSDAFKKKKMKDNLRFPPSSLLFPLAFHSSLPPRPSILSMYSRSTNYWNTTEQKSKLVLPRDGLVMCYLFSRAMRS